MKTRIAILLLVVVCSASLHAQAPTLERLTLEVQTLTEKVEYLRDLVEQLAGRVTVLEARVVPMTCKVSMLGVPVSCTLK